MKDSVAPAPAKRKGASSRGRRRRWVWAVGMASLALVLLAAASGRTPLERLTHQTFDLYQILKPRSQAGAPVTVVDIDEASLGELGQWPWSRALIARMVEQLGEMGAAAIVFDMVFAEPDRTSPAALTRQLARAGIDIELPPALARLDNDALLAEAFARYPVVAGLALSDEQRRALPAPKAGFAWGGHDPRTLLRDVAGGVANLDVLDGAATGLGVFSFARSHDGVVRRLPLIQQAGGQVYPALALEALRVAQGASGYIVRTTAASGQFDSGVPAIVDLRAGAFTAPTGPEGWMWVYYSGLADMVSIPAARLLDDDALSRFAPMVSGHIVLIGTSALGLRDLVATPVDAAMPGVNVHAEMIDQIMGQQFLVRPDWAVGFEVTLTLLAGLLLIVLAARGGALVTSAAALSLLCAVIALSWGAFALRAWLVDPLLPAAGLLAVFLTTMPLLLLLTDVEKRFVRSAFSRYLSPTLVDRLAEHPQALTLGGETRELTLLFSDIRGFTTLSETLDPDALTTLLNDFLTPMTDVLMASNATIDKYMGDAIMAFWNAPLPLANHPRRACLAALAMSARLQTLNQRWKTPVSIGIGLHTGPACVGNLGSAQRFSYSAIGDSVNLASRVEGLTKSYGVEILVTETVRDQSPGLAFLEVDRVRVVGRRAPVVLYTLLGDEATARSADFITLSKAHRQLMQYWYAAEPAAAEHTLHDIRRLAPPTLEGLYALYARRLQAMIAKPAPAGWDGVFDAQSK
ncbi:adenylate/guanylate cyclase domain-containing protein [Halomonas sp. PAMB 3264]|uniref:CHASE2 domain-containing protein n=1 Tax=Halomonas sp. PAMB 3264 TaxID=3075222 RepID=UPI00289EBEF7|nr:adenylate/guanylate cyclase domain-containing protein [Halomonas sp. PAMB 3264]WNL42985.1 adenylate/guanylate cyclase domain-containing protein [Halomonas sp. PAMB 3264]